MNSKFSSTIGKTLIFTLFGMIIIGFVFTGFTPDAQYFAKVDTVASVDGTPISSREFSNAFKRSSEMFKGSLNNQMRDFFKQQVLQQLIAQKIYQNFATTLDIDFGEDKLKSEIKELPYFKTNEQFDVNLYKRLLISNQITPSDFEQEVKANLKVQAADKLLGAAALSSENFLKDYHRFENFKADLRAIKIEKKDLQPFVTVDAKEVQDFVQNEKNLPRLQSEYNLNKEQFVKPEQVKAAHILIKSNEEPESQEKALAEITALKKNLTTKNFKKIASEKSQDPSAKQNSGDLGWFPRGQMSENFEDTAFSMKKGTISEPVKTEFGYHLIYLEDKKPGLDKQLDQVKEQLAKSIIQKQKTTELDQLYEQVTNELYQAYAENKTAVVNKIVNDYNLTESKNLELSLLSGNILNSDIDFQYMKEIFLTQNKNSFLQIKGPEAIVFKVQKIKKAEVASAKDLEEKQAHFNNEKRFEVLQALREKASIQQSAEKIKNF